MGKAESGNEPLITLGEIVAPHGIRGEVRLVPTTDFPERFLETERVGVELDSDFEWLTVKRARFHKGLVVLQFAEVVDRDGAEELRGALVKVPASELVPLPEGEFYRFELLGLTVVDERGVTLGTVDDILETGANDVLVVAPADPERTRPLLNPTIREVVTSVEPAAGVIRVKLLPGLLEL